MTKGEIVIDELRCKGCDYCVYFCSRKCISISAGRLTAKGFAMPVVTSPDSCTGCGVCGWLCPEGAIQVFKYVESESR